MFKYQTEAVERHCDIIFKFGVSLDASDTGVGKTWISLGVCEKLKLRPFIIAPKQALDDWYDVCERMNIMPLGVVNHEAIKSGKYYKTRENLVENVRCDCPFVKIVKGDFMWNFPPDCLVILDEAHKGKNMYTLNSKMFLTLRTDLCKEINTSDPPTINLDLAGVVAPIIILSATIAENENDFHFITYLLGITQLGKHAYASWRRRANTVELVHKEIFPEHGNRIRKSDLLDLFKLNDICAQTYEIDDETAAEIAKTWDMAKLFPDVTHHLAEMSKLRQRRECLKLNKLAELAKEEIANGRSVVIFVNFIESIEILKKMFDCGVSIIRGGQSVTERHENIDNFRNKDISRILISQIGAGGVCLSLHDINGKYPRTSLISPPLSCTALKQALGRVHRAGGKSDVKQRIIYIKGKGFDTEETIAAMLNKKLQTIEWLNNGDDDDLIIL